MQPQRKVDLQCQDVMQSQFRSREVEGEVEQVSFEHSVARMKRSGRCPNLETGTRGDHQCLALSRESLDLGG